MPTDRIALFLDGLSTWFDQNDRPLPWKGERDPYLIWLSEIILQQTRVEQGMPYFKRFRERYPTVKVLADAAEDEVMKLWEGLGYYSRARNLHATAKYIAYELDGQFPQQHKEILKLKGVGPYTAAAIASFAYDLPEAVVDGNVYRVLARFWGTAIPVDSTAGKKHFAGLAQELLQRSAARPSEHNQAMMDFGAVQCKPKAPRCETCLLKKHCVAFQQQQVTQLPVKQKKLVKKNRYFHYLVLSQGAKVYIRKRLGKDIWRNLYEFPLLESDSIDLKPRQLKRQPVWKALANGQDISIDQVSPPRQQTLTHQYIQAVFWEISMPELAAPPKLEGLQGVERKNLSKFAFPKIIDWYLRDNSLYLKLL